MKIDLAPILFDAQRIKRTSKALGETHPAMRKLRRDAQKCLDTPPPSVMEKSVTPPSGDKHDYMSIGTYWWPDPDKSDALPYVRRDGEANPEGDQYDVPRINRFCASVQTLTLAWTLFGQEEFARTATDFLQAWFLDPQTRMNPHLNFAQAIPGRCEGRGIGIIDTEVLYPMLDAVRLLAADGVLDNEDLRGIVNWFDAYTEWLVTSELGQTERDEHNNHGTAYDAQVASFAYFAGRNDIAIQALKRVGPQRIDTQVEADGAQPYELERTRSLSYTHKNMNLLLDLGAIGKRLDVDIVGHVGPEGQTVASTVEWMIPYWTGKKAWEHQQIIRFNTASAYNALRKAAWVLDTPRYAQLADQIPEQTLAALPGLPESDRVALRANLLWP